MVKPADVLYSAEVLEPLIWMHVWAHCPIGPHRSIYCLSAVKRKNVEFVLHQIFGMHQYNLVVNLALPCLLQTWFLLFWPNSLVIDLSGHKTFLQKAVTQVDSCRFQSWWRLPLELPETLLVSHYLLIQYSYVSLFLSHSKVLFSHVTVVPLHSFSVFFPRAQTTAWWKSGEPTTGVCWRPCAVTLLRSPTWPWATRTPWSLPGPVTRPSECGAYKPAHLWPSWRGTRPPSPPYR